MLCEMSPGKTAIHTMLIKFIKIIVVKPYLCEGMG